MRFPSLIGTVLLLARSGGLAHHLPADKSAAADPAPSATDSPAVAAVESPAYDGPLEARLANLEPYTWSEAGYRWPMDLCGESTFQLEVDAAQSPLVSDCALLVDRLSQDTKQVLEAGGWKEEFQNLGEFAAICVKDNPADPNEPCVRFGTGSCTFGFRPDSYAGPKARKIGYTDIVDVMRDAIARVGDGKRVGASGHFDCGLDDSFKTYVGTMHWKIWNPNTQHGS